MVSLSAEESLQAEKEWVWNFSEELSARVDSLSLIDQELGGFKALMDWYPGSRGFYLSLGTLRYSEEIVADKIVEDPEMSVFTWSEGSRDSLSLKDYKPYLGLGFDMGKSQKQNSGFFLDMGLMLDSELYQDLFNEDWEWQSDISYVSSGGKKNQKFLKLGFVRKY